MVAGSDRLRRVKDDFDALVAPYRAELHAHCYRMLGSVHDADDALQEALLGAFRGFGGFEGRSSLRSWLYRIATNACLQRIAKRPKRVPSVSQQATLRALGEQRQRALVAAFVEAWSRADIDAILALLVDDARFSMPPIPTWFGGREAIRRFMAERMFATAWRLVPARASGQLAFACYQGPEFRLGALNVLTLRGGEIAELTAFLDPALHARLGLAPTHR